MADTPATTNDGTLTKVTLALLGERMLQQAEERAQFRTEFKEFRQEFKEWCKEHNTEHGDIDERLTRNEERVKVTTGILGGLELALSALAAWLGIKLG